MSLALAENYLNSHLKNFFEQLFDHLFWINFLSLSIGSLAFATSIYFLAAMELGSQKASSFTFMVPAAAMIFAMIILGEKLELTTLIGGGMAILAVYLINRK